MKKIFALVAVLAAAGAHAEGWVCQVAGGELNVKVYNQVDPNAGVRNAAIMVISDPSVQYGNKTVATIKAGARLTNSAALYMGKIDLRTSGASRGGEYLLGTRLAQVDQVALDIDFSYAKPIAHGARTSGELTLKLRNGEEITRNAVCTRYLKN